MRIIIVGCGKVGTIITEQLSLEGHDITVVDSNSHVIETITNSYDVMGVVGDGASYSVQMEAGVEEADLLIANTDSDEKNLLCCMIAKKAGNCSTIARVRNHTYSKEINFIKEELGLAMAINPEYAAAVEISRLLRFPSAIKIDTFSKGRVEILEFKVAEHSILDGMSLMDLGRKISSDVLICAAVRGEKIQIPKGNFKIQAGDVLSLIAAPRHAKTFFKKIGLETHQVKDAMIVGGGMVCVYLAELLIQMGVDVKIIDKDEEKCHQLSALFPEAEIINDDAINQDVLIEEGVDHCSSFVSLTGIDEANIFLSLFARSRSENVKLITKINRISFDNIVNEFNLGSIISPKTLTADRIVRYVRAMQNTIGSNIETLYKIVNKKAEALEFKIQKNSPVIGKPLEELKILDNLLVACVNHNGNIATPNGKTVIREGDTVVIVTTRTGLKDISDILIPIP